jgi:hypothetical protein
MGNSYFSDAEIQRGHDDGLRRFGFYELKKRRSQPKLHRRGGNRQNVTKL